MHALIAGRRAVVLAALLGLAPVAAAESPADAIEIYHGARKVAPLPKPPADPAAGPRAVAAVAATVEDATRAALQSTGSALGRLIDRGVPKWDAPRLPVVVNVTVPQPPAPAPPVMVAGGFQPTAGVAAGSAPPALLPWAYTRDVTPREEPKPQVIVIREAAPAVAPALVPEPRPEAGGVRLSAEALAAVFGSALVAALVALLWRVRPRAAGPAPVPAQHLSIRGLDAGAMPPAQAFEIGPTYAEQAAEEQAAAAAGETALLQHILDQNLALRAELD